MAARKRAVVSRVARAGSTRRLAIGEAGPNTGRRGAVQNARFNVALARESRNGNVGRNVRSAQSELRGARRVARARGNRRVVVPMNRATGSASRSH